MALGRHEAGCSMLSCTGCVHTAFPPPSTFLPLNLAPELLLVGCWTLSRASYTSCLLNSVKETKSGAHRRLVRTTQPVIGRTGIQSQACFQYLCFLYCPLLPEVPHHPCFRNGVGMSTLDHSSDVCL